jgi:integrase
VVAAEEQDPRLAPLLMLAALTGMRRGELCALRWTDLDLERGVIGVARSLIVTPGGTAEKSTKTNRERRVALDEVAVLLLRTHRENVLRWAGEIETTLPVDAFVFSPYLDGHSPFRPDNVTNFFIRVRNSLGIKHVRLHDLRHFTATQLIGAGVDVRTVAGRLGHSDPSLTLRVYSHAILERDRAAASIMGKCAVPAGPRPALRLKGLAAVLEPVLERGLLRLGPSGRSRPLELRPSLRLSMPSPGAGVARPGRPGRTREGGGER